MAAGIHIIRRKERSVRYEHGVKLLTCTLLYPLFSSAVFQRAAVVLNDAYQASAEAFRSDCAQARKAAAEEYASAIENGYPFNAHERMQTYAVHFNASCTLSLTTDSMEYTGGAHPMTVRSSDTWDLTAARRVPFSAWFAPGIDSRAYALDSITAQIRAQAGENSPFFGDAETLAQQSFDENQYFLSREGVVLYYQLYDIAPYSSGFMEFTLPYTDGEVLRPRCDTNPSLKRFHERVDFVFSQRG